jgi:protein-disulfide isomerase
MPKRYPTRKPQLTKTLSRRTLWIGSLVFVAVAIILILVLPKLFDGKVKIPNPNGTNMGDANAPVKVEEYSDFQCPYCGIFALDAEPSIIEKYVATGKVYVTYVPFSFLGPESVRSAEAAYCAADQNKFWEFKEKLFLNQGAENAGVFSDARLERFAAESGLNMNSFRDCFSSGKFAQKVQDDLAGGKERGVQGTPYFFVNGGGPYPSTELEARIEAALATTP